MKWSVTWLPAAEDELADCWLNAIDQSQIASAAYTVDQMLTLVPQEVGESREEGSDRRIVYVRPLGVVYKVFPSTFRVQVQRVWHY